MQINQMFSTEISYKNKDESYVLFNISVSDTSVDISCSGVQDYPDKRFTKEIVADFNVRIMDTIMLAKAMINDQDPDNSGIYPVRVGITHIRDMINGKVISFPYNI